ncbi:MAG: phospho-sugar mutase [Chlorobi bacterium]|nr:phospho-sugar mutase [Chlorobiota bacterium]
MGNLNVPEAVLQKAQAWLDGNYDEETKAAVRAMLENEDKSELIDAFYKDLEFGTGGLRGIMGAGSNRMNKYTVGGATQGLANYLKKNFADLDQIKVVVGYDCRNNSKEFANIVAGIFSANGIKAYIFDDLRPTPEISFAIRNLGCQSGVIITASHNPKEYNGYKAYWDDGAQVTPPHDKNIIEEVKAISSIDEIKFDRNPALIEELGEEMDKRYLDEVAKLLQDPDVVARNNDLKIVYTPIHGTGVKMIPRALKNIGFTNIIHVPEQDVVSGEFPTVVSPNPEEPAAMEMALKKGREVDADIIMASDPDADRIGIAIKDASGEYILVNGNITALILTWYILKNWNEKGRLTGKEFIVKTVVTTEVMKDVAVKYGVEYYDVFTGFKWIAKVIRDNEGKKKYICGGEESYGFLPGDYVRDKDAVASISIAAEIAAWAKDNGKTLYEVIQDIYLEYGFSKEKMIYIVRKGKTGAEEIEQIMKDFRSNPPKELAGHKVAVIKDYAVLEARNTETNEVTKIDLPVTSNVLQFILDDGSKVSVRPSGTEPKIKFYMEVKVPFDKKEDWDKVNQLADEKIEKISKDLNL